MQEGVSGPMRQADSTSEGSAQHDCSASYAVRDGDSSND